jgi:ACS family hexuronate transporter-like MFS transporter
MNWGWKSAFVVTAVFDLLWVIFWLIFYRSPEKHKRLDPKELEYIRSGQIVETNVKSKGVWKEIIGKKQIWACIAGSFLTGPIWLFYTFWVPMYLIDARGFHLKEIAMFAWLPPLTADIGSLVGGAMSTFFIKYGMPVLKARKLAMFIFASMMPAALFAVRAQSPYCAIAFICIATFGHQSWSANLVTLPIDLFAKRQVASAYGLTGWGGGLGGIIFIPCIGLIIKNIGYGPVFTIAGFMHLISFIIILLLIKKPVIQEQ